VRASLALLIFGGGLAQNTLASFIRVGDTVPDIPLTVVALLAFRRGPEIGCLAGFAGGLLQDVLGGGMIGIQALTKALIGFTLGQIGGQLWVHEPLVQVVGLVSLSMVEGVARFLLMQFFHFPGAFGDLMVHVVLPQSLYNGVIGAALLLAMSCAEHMRERASWR
jgi:rod shape-determining protein MreD